MGMKNDELIEKLSNLKLEENNLKRCLDTSYFDYEKRTELFNRIKGIKKEIQQIKFKIRLEKELRKDEKFR